MSMVTNIVIAGVGGQGTILASRLLGQLAMELGMDIKISEVHGMSQRGGSVVTYVRFGEKVLSPIVEEGEADYLLAFERLEAARFIHMLKKDGMLVMNSQEIMPATVASGRAAYPDDISAKLRSFSEITVYEIDALRIAIDSGFIRAANVALMGAFAAVTNLPYELFIKSLETILNGRHMEENMKAFVQGYEKVREV